MTVDDAACEAVEDRVEFSARWRTMGDLAYAAREVFATEDLGVVQGVLGVAGNPTTATAFGFIARDQATYEDVIRDVLGPFEGG